LIDPARNPKEELMKFVALAGALAWLGATSLWTIPAQAPPALDALASQADGSEPPLRCQLRLGEESRRIEVGRDYPATPGTPSLRVDLLATREFHAPGALAFEFAREWRFSACVGIPTPADAWWTIGGERTTITLRRHALDAQAIEAEYAANARACWGSEVRPAAMALDGRVLEGVAVRFTIGGMHAYESRDTLQEIYGFTAGGCAWLLVIQRDLGQPGDAWPAPLLLDLEGRELRVDWPPPDEAQESKDARQLLASSWRWL
jgi:hypothetical protein